MTKSLDQIIKAEEELRKEALKWLPLPIVSSEQIEKTFEGFGKSIKKLKED